MGVVFGRYFVNSQPFLLLCSLFLFLFLLLCSLSPSFSFSFSPCRQDPTPLLFCLLTPICLPHTHRTLAGARQWVPGGRLGADRSAQDGRLEGRGEPKDGHVQWLHGQRKWAAMSEGGHRLGRNAGRPHVVSVGNSKFPSHAVCSTSVLPVLAHRTLDRILSRVPIISTPLRTDRCAADVADARGGGGGDDTGSAEGYRVGKVGHAEP